MATKKPVAKKAVAKKPAAKKPVTKKSAAVKPAVKKASAAKKPAAKKAPAAKKSAASAEPQKPRRVGGRLLRPGKRVKPDFKRVPLRIVKKPTPVAKPQAQPVHEIDTAKAVAFAMAIAEEMKRSAARADTNKSEDSIRLTRRPTTRAQGKSTAKFPASDLKEFRRRLIEARAKALAGANQMRSAGFNDSEDHEADGGDGTNQTLRLQALGQVGNINRTIQQIDEALHRIDDGTYGVCTVCGQLIRKPRLMNQPFVLTCMECQSEMERGTLG